MTSNKKNTTIEQEVSTPKIATPAELRCVLLSTIDAVVSGRINVQMANAVVGLSSEIHKSVRQEWDMRCYAADNLSIQEGDLVKKLLDDGDDDK